MNEQVGAASDTAAATADLRAPTSQVPGSARSPRRRKARLQRRTFATVQALLRRDLVFATAMAVSMTLSAFAVYEATRAADDAEETLDQIRVIEDQSARAAGSLETLIANDAAILFQQCAVGLDGDAARASLLSPQPDVSGLLASTLELGMLRPLVLGDRTATCEPDGAEKAATYSVDQARQRFGGESSSGTLALEAERLREDAAGRHAQERLLFLAGLLFVIVVAGLIVVDQLDDRHGRPARWRGRRITRWRAGITLACAVVFLSGVVLLAVGAVDHPATELVLAGLAVLLVAEWLWSRRSGPSAMTTSGRPRWWAEIVGAGALAAFSVAAVALSVVSINERDAMARADRQSSVAEQLQQTAQQRVARDVAAVSSLAGSEADTVAAAQLAATGFGDAIQAQALTERSGELDRRLQSLEDSVRDGLADGQTEAADPLCPAEDAATGLANAPDEYLTDPDLFAVYLDEQKHFARVCDTAASLTRMEARLWAERGSHLTVALVVLGLSGFVLALAAGRDRTRRASAMLLAVGAAGSLVGVVITAITLVETAWRVDMHSDDSKANLAEAVAQVETDACRGTEGVSSDLEEAFGSARGDGRAHQQLGYAYLCDAYVYRWPMISSEVDREPLAQATRELSDAARLGPRTAQLEGDLGFALIQLGIVDDDDDTVQDGLEHTEAALASLDEVGLDAGDGPHYYRMNRGLALAALGRDREAVEAYTEARSCLALATDCGAGGILDPGRMAHFILWGLADLELIEDSVNATRLDEYRRRALGVRASTVVTGSEPRLSVFPQELQVTGLDFPSRNGGPPIVWYFRAPGTERWAVLSTASEQTLRQGEYVVAPVRTEFPLPEGEYRADIYANEEKTQIFDELGAGIDVKRVATSRLGISAIVPVEWEVQTDDGVEWRVGLGDVPGLAVRREDVVFPPWDESAYLFESLEEWIGQTHPTAGDPGQPVEDWFLGLSSHVTVQHTDPLVRGAAALVPFGQGVGCGATILMAMVDGEGFEAGDPPQVRDLVLDRLPVDIPAHSGTLSAGNVTVDVPLSWDAAVRPTGGAGDLLFAKDCTTGAANVIVNQEPNARPLATTVDETLAEYVAPEGLPSFRLVERGPASSAGLPAEQILYTWDPVDQEPVTQRQMFASDGETLTIMTVTSTSEQFAAYETEIGEIMDSLEVRSD